MKATMMKVSDPIIFGHAVTVYYKDVFEKHAAVFDEIGVDPNNGIGDVYAKIAKLPEDQLCRKRPRDYSGGVRAPTCTCHGQFG